MRFRPYALAAIPALAVLATSVASLAASPSFEDLDQNKDGRLSKQEVSIVEGLDFAKADTNKDGSLDRSEYEKAVG